MTESTYEKSRPSISAEIRRSVEVEAGHCCAINGCGEHTYLEIHHIDENRENIALENLILLCDKHHKMAHAKIIDRKSLREYKRLLSGSAELTKESLSTLLTQILGEEIAKQLLSGTLSSVPVVLHPVTTTELEPYTTEGLISLQPTHSICAMGAGNRVGNHVEERKRPYGLGNASCCHAMANHRLQSTHKSGVASASLSHSVRRFCGRLSRNADGSPQN